MSVFYPQGTYVVRFIEQALGAASTGNAQLVLRFKVLGPVAEDGYGSMEQPQYERTSYLTITEKTMQYLPDKLASLGYTGGSISRLDPNHPQHHSFVDQDGRMYCKHEPGRDGGDMREKWDIARVAGPLEVKPVEPKKLRDLDALFARQLKSNGGATPKAQPKPAANAEGIAGGITDDDVPFMRYEVPCL